MRILLTAATTFEIQPAIDAIGESLHYCITGIGGVPTTWSLMRQIDSQRPDLIIQAGIAGCFTGEKPGSVFAVLEDELADLGVWQEGGFRSVFDLGLADANTPPFSGKKLRNPYNGLLAFTRLPLVSALTVNEITTDPTRIDWYRQNSNAVVESMEGGSLHYVCLRGNIPFLQLRSISNTIGVRDKTKWDIPLAIARLNEQLIKITRQLGSTDASLLTSLKPGS